MKAIDKLMNWIEEEIFIYRLLCMIGAAVYIVFRPTGALTIDSLRGRLIISSLWFILVLLSYVSNYVKRNLIYFIYGLIYVTNIHYFYLTYLNRFNVDYFTGLFLIIIISNISFNERIHLILYNNGVITAGAVSYFLLPEPHNLDKGLYLKGILLVSLVCYLSFSRRTSIQQKLKRSRQEKLAVLNSMPEEIWYQDEEYKVVWANETAAERVGKSIEEMIGEYCYNLRLDKNQPCKTCPLKKVSLQGGFYEEKRVTEEEEVELIRVYPVKDYEPGRFIKMVRNVTERRKQEEVLRRNLEKAKKLHRNLLPDDKINVSQYSFSALYFPAQELGGDFYNLKQVGDQLIFYLADVSGHGLDGALLNIMARENINNYIASRRDKQEEFSPRELTRFISSKYFEEDFPEDYFLCVKVGVLDLTTYKLKIANSGIHIPTYIINERGNIYSLEDRGLPISNVIDFSKREVEEKIVKLSPGDKLFLTTDGLIEQTRQGEIYGKQRVKEVLKTNHYLDCEFINEAVKDNLEKFTGNLNWEDDVTYLTLELNPEGYFKDNLIINQGALKQLKEDLKDFFYSCRLSGRKIKLLVESFYRILKGIIEQEKEIVFVEQIINVEAAVTKNYIRIKVSFENYPEESRKFSERIVEGTNIYYDEVRVNEPKFQFILCKYLT